MMIMDEIPKMWRRNERRREGGRGWIGGQQGVLKMNFPRDEIPFPFLLFVLSLSLSLWGTS